jgi:hypothetical protein
MLLRDVPGDAVLNLGPRALRSVIEAMRAEVEGLRARNLNDLELEYLIELEADLQWLEGRLPEVAERYSLAGQLDKTPG